MKFTVTALATALISAAAVVPVAAGVGATIAYDTTYDNGGLSINSVACSDGQYGLGTKGYKTLGALPKFPNVAAVETIPGWNSPNCGKCYKLYYQGKTVYVIGVDHAATGFVTSQNVLDQLTGGHAVEFGRVNGFWAAADPKKCGF